MLEETKQRWGSVLKTGVKSRKKNLFQIFFSEKKLFIYLEGREKLKEAVEIQKNKERRNISYGVATTVV